MRNIGIAPLVCALPLVVACNSTTRDEDPPAPAPETAGVDPLEASTRPPRQDPTGDDFLEQEWERLTLEEQKAALLVEQALANAESFRSQLRLEDALAEIEKALSIDGDNLRAKRMYTEIAALLGRPDAEIQTLAQELEQSHSIRMQQLLADARESVQQAELMLARGDYDGAVAELTLALDHIRWAPASVDWQGLDTAAQTMLERARAERQAALAAERESEARASLQQLRGEEEAERDRRQRAINQMIQRAIDAFEMARYEDAMDAAEEALRVDPRNDRAREIRDAAFRAGRIKVRDEYVQRKRESFKRWEEEMRANEVPWIDIVRHPDPGYWAEITELRKSRPGIDLSRTVDPTEVALRDRLATTRIRGLEMEDEESLRRVISTIQLMTGLPLVVHELAEEAAIDEGVVFTFRMQNPITVEDALNIITAQAGEEVTWTVRYETVIITTREKARGRPIIYNHDVQDLIFGLTEFFGPRIDRIRLLDEMEDDDGNGPFGAVGERPVIIEEDALAALVQENVAPGSWDAEGVSINAEMGFLIVVHTPEVQSQVRRFLEDLRRFSSSLVTIESKFLTVEDNWLQEIGVEFRGLDNPNVPFTDLDDITNGLEDMAAAGLDNFGTGDTNIAGPPAAGFFYDDGGDGEFKAATNHLWQSGAGNKLSNEGALTLQWTLLDDAQVSMILRAVEKQQNIELVNDQILSVHNTQRAYVTVLNQRAYIQDFDVEVAQFEAVADPQINVLIEGVVLDVQPTIHHSRKYLTLEIQPTVAEVVALENFSTTLGGQTSPVEFQLPELQVQSVFTTAVVPDGGSILLGGLSRIRNIERRAEVPWLANIPVVGFFFKEEAYNDERQSLMIMLRAWITDVKEELQAFETR